ncbi:hypothetical protein ACFOSC_26540 [Streptantibioticus rubrisoli]|uniref:Lipoprotein n=1 Tax=Streptantibioticus rubrisoli TaxID=1387313 RepID=A0ABT1PES7_9ACTN|nr:hypothetical protein [Streptantibioticus rubrisoli]MCQ4043865.1 hypothetical protein [Streptantibioticus rubrisoli]
MRRTVLPIAAILLTAACSGTGAPSVNVSANDPAASRPADSLDAAGAFKALAAAVPSAKLTGTVTAENDPNKLLGRPNQYTSKVTFSDSRISKSDTQFLKAGDVELGGAIEMFPDPAAAKTRADYIQSVTKSLPALAEYDYQHSTVLVRVSHYLTPDQAAAYKAAADKLG